jgi:hypothetical protein
MTPALCQHIAGALKYLPMEHVTIVLFGLHYPGRVVRCVLEYAEGPVWLYDVQYVRDGELVRGEFHADELEPRNV